jgi:hypothetical protein
MTNQPQPTGQPDTTGFSAASPYAICQLYADGKITREQVIAELGAWPYKPPVKYDVIDQLPLSSSDGTWDEVVHAADRDLIDDTIYEEARLLKNELRATRQNQADDA